MPSNPAWYDEARALQERGHSAMSIARCLAGVNYREIEAALDFPAPPVKRFSDAYWEWHKQQPWVWRPDNTTPTEAPWERTSREFY